MNRRQARQIALQAMAQQGQALLESGYLDNWEGSDREKIERELDEITQRLFERAFSLSR